MTGNYAERYIFWGFLGAYSRGGFPQKWKFYFSVGEVSTSTWWSEETKVLEKESKSNSGCWELCDVVLCKDLSDLTLLCGKADGLGNVDSEGMCQLRISSTESEVACGISKCSC